MRQLGRLTQWKDEQGFGFITPKGGGEPVFVHIKAFSNRQQRPTRNDIVNLLSMFGGWPGAYVAQNLLHHKSKKQSFQIIFWITVLLNCIGLAWALSP